MTVVAFAEVRPEHWDTLVASSPDAWPFAFTAWRRLILAVPDWQLQDYSFALTNANQLVAVVPLQFDPRNGNLSSTGWGGCGPIVAQNLSETRRHAAIREAFDRMDAIARDTGARQLGFWTLPVTASSIGNVRGVNPFVFYGFEDKSGISQVINLRESESTLWKGLSTTAQQTVRKAIRTGYKVERGAWPELADDYVRIHRETYERTGVTPHPRAYFDGIAREMASHHALWVGYNRTGHPIAFHNDMQFGNGSWYHTGCSTSEALDAGVNYLLFWQSIRAAKTAGFHWYDCGEIFPNTTDQKSKGLTLFKTRFGGDPHRFIKCIRTYESISATEISGNQCATPERVSQTSVVMRMIGRFRVRSDSKS